ncbi:hypothetical protein LPJ78_000624 [Coemansia sp. RSA 989]|nr:eukaryotic integral membrane protein-domain-containing protein [Coemansia mojavensis]KAJ1744177.1 hypothetical protein LPJ68_000237 [Coemansia sp. RSA 1086]KAJ1750020.1 hypothetical protein LPJ79_003268 [Coemansia sp. RSA 1821]KAJ1867925.1 hypothetical protein LPJ78_000624 [Coemansia sp. RSA 989]KAJ1874478.1 hypothetical protein LPJ55_001477 [Coemansia sp. RSA 990]KAJ2633403.1 hypothetical protein H4R22_000504 [Coemansia sp. RSA 1290]KAJ2653095.1 hypothetical protein IWW40_000749 [Coemansi
MRKALAFLNGLPPATKLITFLYLLFSIATFVLQKREIKDGIDRDAMGRVEIDPGRFFILRPGTVISYPWSLATGALVETNLLFAVFGVLALCTVGCFLERQWGTRGYAQFMLVVSIVPALTAILLLVAAYAVIQRAELLYATQLCGLAAVVSGYTVGLKQLVPDYSIKLFRGSVSFRVNDLPGVYTLVAPIMFSLLGNVGSVLLVNIGFFEAFIYLRFYKRSGTLRGDRSQAFAFTTFFPEFIRPFVGRLSNAIYGVAVKFKLVTPDEGYQQAAGLEEGLSTEPVVETDADRRRALATKALDIRLESIASPQPADPSSSKPDEA